MNINKILLYLALILLVACDKRREDHNQYMNLIVIGDPTDRHRLKCDPNQILQLLNLGEHRKEAIGFRYTEVGDMILTPAIDIRLQDAYTSNKKNKNNESLFRQREIVNFYDSVKHTVNCANQRNDSTVGKNNSEIFRKICSELYFLKRVNSRYKGLLCFSNLAENSEITSVYDKEISNLLDEKPQEIQKLFEKTNLLPDRLDSIIILFCYLPLDRNDDRRFNVLSNIYKQMLTKRGARVIIQAGNSFNDLWSDDQ
jgi:hypothetical protein